MGHVTFKKFISFILTLILILLAIPNITYADTLPGVEHVKLLDNNSNVKTFSNSDKFKKFLDADKAYITNCKST